jgi:hypothetical protein
MPPAKVSPAPMPPCMRAKRNGGAPRRGSFVHGV